MLNIVYPKSFAQWAQMQLEVTASVGGTEGFSAMTIPLPILAADVTNAQIAPPSIARTRDSLKDGVGADIAIDPAEGLLRLTEPRTGQSLPLPVGHAELPGRTLISQPLS